ncbi:UNVERIFIED_CONTAM: hypothetical protein PYX00_008259 [Menopon gallinae]|uniref:Ribosomal protein n=1 Tax=Menopon gallinae TaxID=328185 RepID=A0AAW2HMB1_9NEOP
MNGLIIFGKKLSVFANATNSACRSLLSRNFGSILGISPFSNPVFQNLVPNPILKTSLNLIPPTSSIIPKCGIKVRGKPKLRCKHCYYAGIDGILHVLCDVYPRHKQRTFLKRKKKYNWILTHATQSKYRSY